MAARRNMQHQDTGTIYVGNLPKTTTEPQLRAYFTKSGFISKFMFLLEDCTYCPTKVAFISFASAYGPDKACICNGNFFQGKRLLILKTQPHSKVYFNPSSTVMVANLNEYDTEENIYDHFRVCGYLNIVQKPAKNYAYVSFKNADCIKKALKLDSLKGRQIDVKVIDRSISVFLDTPVQFKYSSVEEKCNALGLQIAAIESDRKTLHIKNIPRYIDEDEVIDYFKRFGPIDDLEMECSNSCLLRKVAFVTFKNNIDAEKVFLVNQHQFRGIVLDVLYKHTRLVNVCAPDTACIIKTSNYLTNDEIYQHFSQAGTISFLFRSDHKKGKTYVRFKEQESLRRVLDIKSISDESVRIVIYVNDILISNGENERDSVQSEPRFQNGPRFNKDDYINELMEKEEKAYTNLLKTKPNLNYAVPSDDYSNEVQVNNCPKNVTIAHFQEFFIKCGIVTNVRSVELKNTDVQVCFLSFATKIEARRACRLNQTFMNGKRLLIHLADQIIDIDYSLTVQVSNLSRDITEEGIFDRFSCCGSIKFVQKKTPKSAIVCFKAKNSVEAALRIDLIANEPVSVSRLEAPKQDAVVRPAFIKDIIGVSDPTVHIPSYYSELVQSSMTPKPISLVLNPTPKAMSHSNYCPPKQLQPIKNLLHPKVNLNNLLQNIQSNFMDTTLFNSISTNALYQLVENILDQFLNNSDFINVLAEERIQCLQNGLHNFRQAECFNIFPYKIQRKLVAIIKHYYMQNCQTLDVKTILQNDTHLQKAENQRHTRDRIIRRNGLQPESSMPHVNTGQMYRENMNHQQFGTQFGHSDFQHSDSPTTLPYQQNRLVENSSQNLKVILQNDMPFQEAENHRHTRDRIIQRNGLQPESSMPHVNTGRMNRENMNHQPFGTHFSHNDVPYEQNSLRPHITGYDHVYNVDCDDHMSISSYSAPEIDDYPRSPPSPPAPPIISIGESVSDISFDITKSDYRRTRGRLDPRGTKGVTRRSRSLSHRRSRSPYRTRRRTRSPLAPRQRSRSPYRRQRTRSPLQPRRRTRSPLQSRRRTRSPLPPRRRTRSPLPPRRRGQSPITLRKQSRSPIPPRRRTRSPLPPRRRTRSPLPPRKRTRSPLRPRKRTRSPLPRRKRTRSPLPPRKRTRSPLPPRKRTRSPLPPRRRTRSPLQPRRRTRSPVTARCRSHTSVENFTEMSNINIENDNHLSDYSDLNSVAKSEPMYTDAQLEALARLQIDKIEAAEREAEVEAYVKEQLMKNPEMYKTMSTIITNDNSDIVPRVPARINEIYVANLSNDTTEEELKDLFEIFGDITNIKIPPVKYNSLIAFIAFSSPTEATRALAMNLQAYKGKILQVSMSNDKPKQKYGYTVTIFSDQSIGEIDIYKGFKKCGEIENFWRKVQRNDKHEYSVICYKSEEAANAALRITSLKNGRTVNSKLWNV